MSCAKLLEKNILHMTINDPVKYLHKIHSIKKLVWI